jgi:uncharacterized alpha-E superfamily protein
MLSRVAEHLYWLARYVERAENTARVVGVNANLLLDLPRGIAPGWKPLIDVTGANATFEERYQEYGERQVVKFLLGDRDNPGSVINSLWAARENCRTVRDILPRQAWELLNELHIYAGETLQSGLTKRGRHVYLRHIIRGSQLLTGMLGAIMTRDEGYQFLRLGRNLERADMTSRLIDVRSADLLPDDVADLRPFDTVQWISVLNSLSAYQMYRRAMQVQVRRQEVLKFLFKDSRFPRAILHCVDAVEESVGPLKNNTAALDASRRVAKKILRTRVERLEQIALHQFVDDLQLGFTEMHGAIAATYFLPAGSESQSQTQAA